MFVSPLPSSTAVGVEGGDVLHSSNQLESTSTPNIIMNDEKSKQNTHQKLTIHAIATHFSSVND
jgi:hypothetical protein